MNGEIKKILIIQTASIGDVILATPVMEKLHAYFPQASIDFFLKKGNESLFAQHPFLREILVWDKSSKKHKHLYTLIKKVRAEKYDLVICLQRFFSGGLVAALSKGKKIIGFDKNPLSCFFYQLIEHIIGKSSSVHEVTRNLSLINNLTDNIFEKPKLYPSPSNREGVRPYKSKPYICIAPLSLWFTKQFPKEKWIEFAQIINPSYNIYYLGSKSDACICDEIIYHSKHPNSVNLSGKIGLLESAALMQDAVMNFVNDSAPMHLASAVNAKTTAIFCSTVPEFGFGPLSDDAIVVQTEMELNCRPCGLHGHKHCPHKHFQCGNSINVNELLGRCE
jgi:heptosyltransferase-2